MGGPCCRPCDSQTDTGSNRSKVPPAKRFTNRQWRGGTEYVTEYGLTCPVIEQQDAQGNPVRVHVPFAFKSLKELKTACAQYRPNGIA